ncbi:translation initiation factor IF-2 [Halobacteriales archaeon SW_12_71_31]|nr:MAG: translation initiation factor IF-2 [Halobacteriales archaeon SW_12_71_31]
MTESDSERETDGGEGEGDLRTPIVAVLGHVDHGKTTLLDTVRGSAVSEAEAGAITQHIGATAVPLSVVSEIAGELVDPSDFDLPGLLFIDTPGHHSFTTLRSRGGALADIAVLVVDATDGFQPQTEEAVEILKRTETPFVVAANKVDTVPGWQSRENAPIRGVLDEQNGRVTGEFNERVYDIVGDLSTAGFNADLYWQVPNFQENVGVVPVSAVTGEGLPDLLTVMMGLSQRYMKDAMAIDTEGPGVGTVLEVTEEKGFGATVDVVLYDGTVREDDRIVVGSTTEPIVTDVRALLQPRPLAEIRTEDRFERIASVSAAAGIKIAAPDLDAAMAGAPVRAVGDRDVDEVMTEVRAELASLAVDTDDDGIVLKADTLGSLEAMANALREAEVPIMRAEVGDVAPRDVTVAGTAGDPVHRAVLGFNVDVLDDAAGEADREDVELFTHDVIYRLVEEYEAFVAGIEESQQEQVLENITRPARFRVLVDHVFRQSDPAVVGVDVVSGTLRRNVPVALFSGGEPERVGTLKSIQDQGEDVDEARAGDSVAVSIDGPTVGRDIDEGDELWVDLPEKHAKILEQELAEAIPADELETLSAYLEKRRKRDAFWGK